MNFRRIAPLLAFPLIAAGCASNPAQDAAKQDQQDAKVSCERTYRVGSMMPKKDCEPPLTQEERARMQEELSRIRPSGSQPPGK